jgi:hypothetical protein
LSNDTGVHGATSSGERRKVRIYTPRWRRQDYLNSLGAFEDVSVGQDITLRIDDDAGTYATEPPNHQRGFAAGSFFGRGQSRHQHLDNAGRDSFH